MYNLLFVLVTPAYLVFCIQFSIDIIDNTIMYHCSFSLMLSCIVDSVNSVSCFVSILPTRPTLDSIPSWRPQHLDLEEVWVDLHKLVLNSNLSIHYKSNEFKKCNEAEKRLDRDDHFLFFSLCSWGNFLFQERFQFLIILIHFFVNKAPQKKKKF